jgi:hypothetical protein
LDKAAGGNPVKSNYLIASSVCVLAVLSSGTAAQARSWKSNTKFQLLAKRLSSKDRTNKNYSLLGRPLRAARHFTKGQLGISIKSIRRGFHRRLKTPAARLEYARKVLKLAKLLTPEQKTAILQAHAVGRGELGKDSQSRTQLFNYTYPQIAKKARILHQVGFKKAQIRRLMKKGVVGDNNDKLDAIVHNVGLLGITGFVLIWIAAAL